MEEFGVRKGRKRGPQSWSVHCFMKRTIGKSCDRKTAIRSEVSENNRNLRSLREGKRIEKGEFILSSIPN